jgi:putative peptidoglycan lipid II flippase
VRLGRASAVVAGWTVVSRISGFLRDVLIAAVIGAGPLGDALLIALKLPNLLRRLFAEGALAAAFVPLYAQALEQDGEAVARRFAGSAMGALAAGLLVLVAVAELAMPLILAVIAPGFSPGDGRYEPALELARATFPYLVLVALVGLAGGVLNAHGRFAAAAFTPVLLNLLLIGVLLLPWGDAAVAAAALAWAVPLAGAAQLAWLLRALRRDGLSPSPTWPRPTPALRRLVRLFLPLALAAGAFQINVAVNTIWASTLPAGAVAALYFADRLCQLPLGVIGVALGTALLPLLARHLNAGRDGDALAAQNRALEAALLLTVPATAALLILREPIVVTLFERGAFDAVASAATAAAVAAFALGLPAQVMVRVLAPGFYARTDSRTPLRLALAAVGTNLLLTVVLIGPLGATGIALANALAGWLSAGLHLLVLAVRGQWRADRRLLGRLPRIALATAAMVIVLHLLQEAPIPLSIAAGLIAYAAAAWLVRACEPADLRGLVRPGAA